jgi:hypothetical protein
LYVVARRSETTSGWALAMRRSCERGFDKLISQKVMPIAMSFPPFFIPKFLSGAFDFRFATCDLRMRFGS